MNFSKFSFQFKFLQFRLAIVLFLSQNVATGEYELQRLNGVCISEVHGWGRYLPLENCHLFETEAFKSLSHNFYLRQALYCCPDKPSSRQDNELMPYAPLCGTMLTERIVGGVNAAIDEFPWMARIKYVDKKGRKVFLCGGSLISSRWVLTAAHCVTGHGLNGARVIGVRLGEWNIATNPDCVVDARRRRDCAPPHIDAVVDRVLPHENFDKTRRFGDDIALLRLAAVVEFSDFVKPICLPTAPSMRDVDAVLVNLTAEVAGWGRQSANVSESLFKQKAVLTVRPLPVCQMTYDAWRLQLDGTQLCAGGELGVDTCRGDSGGPLMIETKNVEHLAYFYAAGIVSFGRNMCGQVGHPAVYTRVASYIEWISDKLRAQS